MIAAAALAVLLVGVVAAEDDDTCLCRVTGDPHGFSFDGKASKFQGACTHIQAQNNCNNGKPNKGTPDWIVATKNSRRGETRIVSWVDEVIITVGENVITLLVDGDVLVNGVKLEGLPDWVDEHVHIFDMPNYLNVQTDFGLLVQWDRVFSVRITIDKEIADEVCGMCGTCDGNQDNDWLIGPNKDKCRYRLNNKKKVGAEVNNVNYWGYSWLFGDDVSDDCMKDCQKPVGPDECTDEEKAKVRHECETLKAEDGPFAGCLDKISEDFLNQTMKDCVYDGCHAFANLTTVVCGHGVQLAETCESETGTEVEWRTDDFCPSKCPLHSHYTTCMKSCYPDCDNPKGLSCPTVDTCLDGCECDEGYYFNNGTCMEPKKCGCEDKVSGAVVPVGTVIVRDNCTKQCSCNENGGEIECEEFACRDDQVCDLVEGVETCVCPLDHGDIDGKCVPPATCRCTGDPHCDTFDDVHFSYQGACKYTLAQDNCKDGLPNGDPSFQVVINNDRVRPTKRASRVNSVEIFLGGDKIVLHNGGMVTVNDDEVVMPTTAGPAQIYEAPNYVYVVFNGVRVMWDRVYSVKVTVPGDKFDTTCGLCGNYNADKEDDIVLGPTESSTCTLGKKFKGTPGEPVEDEVVYGNSWFHSVDEAEKGCKEDCKDLPYPDKCEDKKALKRCEKLKNRKGPMKACLDTMTNAEIEFMYQDCVFDTCETGIDGEEYVCAAAAATMDKCLEKGVKDEWRTDDFCPPECPEHSEYKRCADPCMPTCEDPKGVRCAKNPQPCQEGCFCKEGFVSVDGGCYREAECRVLRKPCRGLRHPITGKSYDARVMCWTCSGAADDAECLKTGSLEKCLVPNAICEIIKEGGKITRQCQARKDCPDRSIGEELCDGGRCSQCHYGDIKSNKEPTPLFKCQPFIDRSACALPKKSGSGDDKAKRFYFSNRKCKCQTFNYLGSGGNENNFPSIAQCTEACGQWEIPERCLEKPDVGTGPEEVQRLFAYDHAKMKCKKLKYTGEGGNNNRFTSKKECRKTCKKC